MKKAGIVGGIGPASTLDYYNGIVGGVRAAAMSDDYPRLVIDSVNMTEMIGYVANGDWERLTELLAASVAHLASAGAEFAAIASNTPHLVFDALKARVELPLISIVEETCRYAAERGVRKAAVLGTRFTMRSDLYTEAFRKYGIDAVVPDEKRQSEVYGIIFPNLENGVVLPEEKERLLQISRELLESEQADALVLGCTELPLAIKPGDVDTVLLDTAQIHIGAIVREILC